MANGILFPFKNTQEGGVFKTTKTSLETTRSNLIAFLTLKKKQRPMRNNFYSPYYDYLFEPWDEIADANLQSDLVEKVKQFFPEIELSEIQNTFVEAENVLQSKIIYSIPILGNVEDEITLSLSTIN